MLRLTISGPSTPASSPRIAAASNAVCTKPNCSNSAVSSKSNSLSIRRSRESRRAGGGAAGPRTARSARRPRGSAPAPAPRRPARGTAPTASREVITSSGRPIRNRPSTRYSTRSTSGSTGLISCVTNSTAVFAARRRSSISELTTCWLARSSDSSGSSHSSTSGSLISACATRSRCCSPPESRPTGASAKACAPTASSARSTRSRRARMPRRPIPHRCPSSPRPTRSRPRSVRLSLHRALLRDVADAPVARRPGRLADDARGARGQRLQAEQHAQQARLARPVRSEHGDELAGRDVEVEPLPQDPAAVTERGAAQGHRAGARRGRYGQVTGRVPVDAHVPASAPARASNWVSSTQRSRVTPRAASRSRSPPACPPPWRRRRASR